MQYSYECVALMLAQPQWESLCNGGHTVRKEQASLMLGLVLKTGHHMEGGGLALRSKLKDRSLLTKNKMASSTFCAPLQTTSLLRKLTGQRKRKKKQKTTLSPVFSMCVNGSAQAAFCFSAAAGPGWLITSLNQFSSKACNFH